MKTEKTLDDMTLNVVSMYTNVNLSVSVTKTLCSVFYGNKYIKQWSLLRKQKMYETKIELQVKKNIKYLTIWQCLLGNRNTVCLLKNISFEVFI